MRVVVLFTRISGRRFYRGLFSTAT